MPKQTPIYNYSMLQSGDEVYYDLDQSNMMTVDNQIAALFRYVGPGVVSGWDVASMALTGNTTTDAAITAERQALVSAVQFSTLSNQYIKIKNQDNSPMTEDDWKQVVQVTPGNGIVGTYSAQTNHPYYFRFTTNNFYYVWAETSSCLATQGIARIDVPLPPSPNYNKSHVATYLATVEVVTNAATGKSEVLTVDYGDNRNNLKNLAGALNQALEKYFYHHKHLGGQDHPSQILLTTDLVLNASAPEGSTIFTLSDPSGVFNTQSTYGPPKVLLNNVELPSSAYNLSLSTSKIYLLNSIPSNATLKIVLPLAPQTTLSVYTSTSTIGSPIIYLTDGKNSKYVWDSGSFEDPIVYLRGVIQDPSSYTINPSQGAIFFKTPLTGYINTDLSVVLTQILYEVKGQLSGKRVTNVDASTFTSGVLDSRRLAGLDHVGQIRYQNQAQIKPSLRLFSEGDHQTFYPEIVNSPIQYTTNVLKINSSVNLGPILLGTKRGLFETENFNSFSSVSAWNVDLGEIFKIYDEIHWDDGINHFMKTFVLTKENSIFVTEDSGISWQPLKLPVIITGETTSITPNVISFYASCDRRTDDSKIVSVDYWTEYLYLGTDQGLWTATITEGLTQDEWSWTISDYWRNNPSTIHSIQEIMTLTRPYVSTDTGCDASPVKDKRTLYVGADSGFFVNSTNISPMVVKGFLWINTGLAQNNLLWYTDHSIYLTHTAFHHLAGSEYDCSPDYWTHPLETDQTYSLLLNDDTSLFVNANQASNTNEYYVVSDSGIQIVTDLYDDTNSVWLNPTIYKSHWDTQHGVCKDIFISSSNGINTYIAASSNGLWTTPDLTQIWSRITNQFVISGSEMTVYNETTGQVVTGWTANQTLQAFIFSSVQPLDLNLLYEKDYVNYYVAPWNPAGADVVVYVNGVSCTAPYILSPSLGLINFVMPRLSTDVVTVTIIRLGAYISDVGTIPHAEISNVFVTASTPVTVLSSDLDVTDQIILVKNPLAIPLNTNYIELQSVTGKERIPVTVDPITNQITASTPRTGLIAFPATYTNVFLVSVSNVLGLEDVLSLGASQQTYGFNSLTNDNILQWIIASKKAFPTMLQNFYTQPTQGDRGIKNGLLFNFQTDSLDASASSSTKYVGLEPSSLDSPSDPGIIYSIYNVTNSGEGMIVGTDKGIWACSNRVWTRQSELDGANRVYYIKNITPVPGSAPQIVAGTNLGVYVNQGSSWVLNPTFAETNFDVIPDASMVLPPPFPANATPDDAPDPKTWFKAQYTAYGKNDGIAFDLMQQNGFISDHFDVLDGKKIYGMFKGYYETISAGASDDSAPTINKTDALYLATEEGLFGLSNGNRGGVYSSVLQGRELFVNANNLFQTVQLPSGGTQTVPIKIYKIFQSTRFKTILLCILTSNGVYTSRNWRWADPTGVTNSDSFGIEAHSLDGIPCQCFTAITQKDGTGTPISYKEFIGTDRGVYRSYDEGDTWSNCELISGGSSVYDLKSFISSDNKTVLIAATDSGLWYSIDDGDDWYQPYNDGNLYANYSSVISNGTSFNGQYLSQTFTLSESVTAITKVDLYLAAPFVNATSQNNTLQISLYSTGTDGTPISLIASGSTLKASDILYEGYWSVAVSATGLDNTKQYAIVVDETVQQGGVSVFKWYHSGISNAYTAGKRFFGDGLHWTETANLDYFFKVYEQQSATPTATNNYVDFSLGDNVGTIINDTGSLTTDAKFAISFVVDDTGSMVWSDPLNPDDDSVNQGRRGAEIKNIVDTLWARTNNTLSYADFWVYSFDSYERTNGYTDDLSLIETLTGALYNNGDASNLYDTAQIAVSALNPQSVADAIINSDASVIQNIVNYMSSSGILRLSDIQNWYSTQYHSGSVWDGTKETISNYADVSAYIVERWANTYTPVIFIISDGDDNGSQTSPVNVAVSAESNWKESGVSIYTFGLGKSHSEGGMRIMSFLSGGKHFDISNGNVGQDWTTALNTFLHGGENNLFTAKWNQKFDFENPVFISSVNTTFVQPTGTVIGSLCNVSFRYTLNRVDWTDWIVLSSGVPYVVNDLILGIEYNIILEDGWNTNGTPSKPLVTNLYHISVEPGVQYLITNAYGTNGSLSEYSLSASAGVPLTSRLSWGIVRGNSSDFADFEIVLNERKGVLPNRQQGIQFTPQISQVDLPTITTDFLKYQVVDANKQPIRWSSTDVVAVSAGGFTIDPARATYQLDGSNGLVYFLKQQPSTIIVTVTITTPPQKFVTIGEATSTLDNRIYSLTNGRWSYDSQIVVLVNGKIKRGGFFANPSEGTITFKRELQETDLVTVFVQNSSSYRVGVEILNYDPNNSVLLENFGLMYSTQSNLPVLSHFNQTLSPTIKNLQLMPNNNPTVHDKLYITYQFVSTDGNEEYGTQTTWWKKGAAESAFTEITTYNNRTVQKTADVGTLFVAGDSVYVIVIPSDGFNNGLAMQSETITLTSNAAPVVTNPTITASTISPSTDPTVIGYVKAGLPLTASYTFNSSTNRSESGSVIMWYNKDNSQTPYATTHDIPENTTQPGQILSYKVIPYDGQNYGLPAESGKVIID